MNKNAAVFLDRDGTLIQEEHYLKDVEKLKLYDKTAAAIKKLNDANIPAIMVTNQSGVARGYFDEENVKFLNSEMNKMLKEKGATLNGFYYCPHHTKGTVKKYAIDCDCRKPKSGMLKQAKADFPEINLEKSFVIGDKECDVLLGQNVNAKGILVKTGHGSDYDFETSAKPDFVAADIKEAIDWVLGQL